jgi:hypothetical protein
MQFLSLASTEQLRAALEYCEEQQQNGSHITNLRWLDSQSARDGDDVQRMIRSPDPLSRRYGIVAATRIARQNRQPLVQAISSDDTDVKQFAESMLSIITASE